MYSFTKLFTIDQRKYNIVIYNTLIYYRLIPLMGNNPKRWNSRYIYELPTSQGVASISIFREYKYFCSMQSLSLCFWKKIYSISAKIIISFANPAIQNNGKSLLLF